MIEPRTEIVLPAAPMMATLAFFREQLGYRLESIMPADDPSVAVLSGHGMRIRLDATHQGDPGLLHIAVAGAGAGADRPEVAPNGTRLRYGPAQTPMTTPPAAGPAVVTRRSSHDDWGTGRAGMLYRDLIPGRMNGHLIASHIRIPDGGPVPDNVHYHDVRFQLIYCYRGWVRLVYEDQGEPFVMHAGDCVLQPPGIRHQVLEASDGLEVVELACPSMHLTTLDHDMELPNDRVQPDREFAGQRFHWHDHRGATWQHDHAMIGWLSADLGIAAATQQLASASVLRASGPANSRADGLTFLFALTGSCQLRIADGDQLAFQTCDAATIPDGASIGIDEPSDHLQLLRIQLS